jgi:PAS domain S-box-containing protein
VPNGGTERKRAPRAPEDNGERLWSLFEAVGVGVVLAGSAAEVKDCNQAALDLLGLNRDQLVGRISFDQEWKARREDGSFCSGEEHPISRAIATRQRVRGEVIGVYRPGLRDWVWLLVNAEPRLADDGSVVEVICSFTDITERKQALAALTEWKNRYDAAMRASGQIFYDWNTVTNEIIWGGDENILGYSADEAGDTLANWMELVHPADRDAVLKDVDRVIATKSPACIEYRVRTKSGSYRLIKDHGHFYTDNDGQVIRMAGFISDITEQRRAEEELRSSEERFRKVFAHAATGMTLQSIEGFYLEVNQAFCEITGYEERDLIGKNYRSITHPEDLARTRCRTEELLAGEVPSFVLEKRYVRKDGRSVWVRNGMSLLGDSEPPRIITLVEDITERKQAEESLRQLSGRLLQAQDEERRRLARELHDGTAQSIAALGMNLSAVRESAANLDARAQKALIESLELADQCIRELRTLSYLLHPPMLDDRGLAPALAGYAEGFAERSGIAVKLDLTPDLGRLPKEVELMLFRVVQESLTNIHHHSGSRTATIRLARYPQDIVLQVRDQGSGMGELNPDGGPVRIGVGIAGMRERVRQIGGRLQIHSRPGGTDVEVVVPLSDPYR